MSLREMKLSYGGNMALKTRHNDDISTKRRSRTLRSIKRDSGLTLDSIRATG